jgi:hypothetical protein
MNTSYCCRCEVDLPSDQFYSRGGKQKHRLASICKSCQKASVNQRIINAKIKWLEYKGGAKCQRCGYDKCIAALEFHHRNPKDKEFSFSKKKSYKFETIKPELDKCDVLCSNCHKEIHHNIIM